MKKLLTALLLCTAITAMAQSKKGTANVKYIKGTGGILPDTIKPYQLVEGFRRCDMFFDFGGLGACFVKTDSINYKLVMLRKGNFETLINTMASYLMWQGKWISDMKSYYPPQPFFKIDTLIR